VLRLAVSRLGGFSAPAPNQRLSERLMVGSCRSQAGAAGAAETGLSFSVYRLKLRRPGHAEQKRVKLSLLGCKMVDFGISGCSRRRQCLLEEFPGKRGG